MKKNTFKRVLAGSLALLTVAAYTPANVGDLIQVKGNFIVANAADTTYVTWWGTDAQKQVRDYITSISDGTTTKTADEIANSRGFDFEKDKILTIVSSIPLVFTAGATNLDPLTENEKITDMTAAGGYSHTDKYALTLKDGVYTYQIVNSADITIKGIENNITINNTDVTDTSLTLTDKTVVNPVAVRSADFTLNGVDLDSLEDNTTAAGTNVTKQDASQKLLAKGNAVFTSTKAFEVYMNLVKGTEQTTTKHTATYDAEKGLFVVTVTNVPVKSDSPSEGEYEQVNFYFNKVTPDYAFALSDDGTKLNATLNNTTSTAASITAKYQAKVKAAQDEIGNSNVDGNHYKYDTVTDLATGGSVPNASRVALTFTNDASGEVTTASSGENYKYTLKITKDGKELADTATVMKVEQATPADQAASTSSDTVSYSTLKHDATNVAPNVTTAGTGTGTLYFTEAGKYKVEYTVFVKKQTKDSSGNVTSTTVEAKTMSYEFTIENKAPLTAANVRLTATATNANAATKPVLNGSTVSASGNTETISKVGIVNGVVEIEVSENWTTNDVITVAGTIFEDATAASGTGASTFAAGNSDTTHTTDGTPKSSIGTLSASTLNTVNTATFVYNNPDYSANDQSIVVQYKLVEAKKAATVIPNEESGVLITEPKWTNRNNASTAFLTSTVDTLDTLEENIWEAISVQNADANDITFEYKKGFGANTATEELDWREDGLPSEAGKYSVFITLDGEVLDTFNLEIAEHALYAAPTADQLSITYGDNMFESLTYVDADGKTVADANVKKPTFVYTKARKLNAAEKKKITAAGEFYDNNAKQYLTVYDVNGEKYVANYVQDTTDTSKYVADTVNLTAVTSATQVKGYLNAGVYVATIKATDGTTTVGKEGYSLLSKDFALTVAKKQLTADMITIAPKTYENGSAVGLTTTGSTPDVVVKDTLADGKTEVAIPVTVAGGTTSESKVNSVDSNGKAIPYEVQLQVTANGTIADGNISNSQIGGMNYTGKATGNWYIVNGGTAMNSIKFTDANTTILDNGKIRFEVTRPADSQFSNGVADFGVVICKDGKLVAPEENGATNTNSTTYPSGKYPKTGNISTSDGLLTSGSLYNYGATTNDNFTASAAVAFEKASAALKVGNGYIEGHQPASWTGAKTTYGANVEVKDAETGVWIVGYVKDKKGNFFYGAPVYLNLVQEATELMQLTLADVPANTVSGSSNDDYNYVNIKSKEDAKENQSATALEKKTWRKSVRNGYSEEKAKYYVYGSYTIPEDGKVKPTAGKGFGIVVAKNGEFTAPDANGIGHSVDDSTVTVKDALKLGKGFIEGKRQANSTTMDEDEYGAYITPADTVTGVWYVGYLALGNGLEVYTDPVYIPPVSNIYHALQPTVTLTKTSATQVKATVAQNSISSVNYATGKQVGVVVDKSGAFINKDANGDYADAWAVNPDDITVTDYGKKKANAALLIGKGYLQGKKTASHTVDYSANLTVGTYSHSTDNATTNIPVVIKPYRVYTIKGNDVAIYGPAVAAKSNLTQTVDGDSITDNTTS